MLRYKLSNIKINVHRYITDKKFFNDKKNKKTECPFKRFWYSTKNTMCNFEIAVRNFLLAEQQAHEQVKKVQIKPSFILKLLTCVSGHSLFFSKCG